MPARSDGQAAGETSAQSRPAIVVPGVGHGGRRAGGERRGQARRGRRLDADHRDAGLRAEARRGRGQRAHADGHEQHVVARACAAASAKSVA